MSSEDTWDKLQKIAKLVILRDLVFASNRLKSEKVSFKNIFYHLVCYLHLVNNKVLANEFDEI